MPKREVMLPGGRREPGARGPSPAINSGRRAAFKGDKRGGKTK